MSDNPARGSIVAWEILNKTLVAYETRCEQKHFPKDRKERRAAARVHRLKARIPEPSHPNYDQAFQDAFEALRDYCADYAKPRLDEWGMPKSQPKK